jgi:hypothetical protein
VWKAELNAACAYLVLEELLERLYELELKILRKATYVMV